jgi:hypothetical protein
VAHLAERLTGIEAHQAQAAKQQEEILLLLRGRVSDRDQGLVGDIKDHDARLTALEGQQQAVRRGFYELVLVPAASTSVGAALVLLWQRFRGGG